MVVRQSQIGTNRRVQFAFLDLAQTITKKMTDVLLGQFCCVFLLEIIGDLGWEFVGGTLRWF